MGTMTGGRFGEPSLPSEEAGLEMKDEGIVGSELSDKRGKRVKLKTKGLDDASLSRSLLPRSFFSSTTSAFSVTCSGQGHGGAEAFGSRP